jgi:C4-dicarboxylate-specific signal transduction histidine kinase
LPKSKLGRLLGSLTRLWPWLLGLLGAGILGLSGVFLYRRLTHRPSPSRVVSRLATSAGQELSEQQRIDLLSRIEELQQENARLQAEVEEKTQQIKKLKKEKESLANERDHPEIISLEDN